MPEYPDIQLYLHALSSRFVGQRLEAVRAVGPNVLRTVDPPLTELVGGRILGFRRLGKRVVLEFEDELFLVVHLMIAGRFQLQAREKTPPKRSLLATFDIGDQRLLLTEASKRKRAGIWVVRGEAALSDLDPGGLEVLGADPQSFAERLRRENHTLKRALTDPTLFSGIGNAYSDEILHRARLSPFRRTNQLEDEAVARLYDATREVLVEWEERLRERTGDAWPKKVTAFQPEMAVHGRYREKCPVCGSPVQRVVHAANEMNYCPGCQTGGRILADRSLSRLLHDDWPRTLEELEQRMPRTPSDEPD